MYLSFLLLSGWLIFCYGYIYLIATRQAINYFNILEQKMFNVLMTPCQHSLMVYGIWLNLIDEGFSFNDNNIQTLIKF